MPLAMPDSIHVADLPAGYPAYLGYADGEFATAAELIATFPDAEHLILTVTGENPASLATHGIRINGIDTEPGNPTAADAVNWVIAALHDQPGSRPVVYADLATPGYSMKEVVRGLTAAGVARPRYRILTAHWTFHMHICGPATCGALEVNADGTQWTDKATGNAGSLIDMSELRSDFFTTGGTMALKPITVLPPGNWNTAVLVGSANGETFAVQWDGTKWTTIAWPVKPA